MSSKSTFNAYAMRYIYHSMYFNEKILGGAVLSK